MADHNVAAADAASKSYPLDPTFARILEEFGPDLRRTTGGDPAETLFYVQSRLTGAKPAPDTELLRLCAAYRATQAAIDTLSAEIELQMSRIPPDIRKQCSDVNPFADWSKSPGGSSRIPPEIWQQYVDASEAAGLRPLMARRFALGDMRQSLEDLLQDMEPTTVVGCVALMEVLFLSDLTTSGDTWRAEADYPDRQRFLALARNARRMAGAAD